MAKTTRPNCDMTLRTDPGPFRAIWRGEKTAELRENGKDRDFQVNDVIELIEFNQEQGLWIQPYRAIYIRVTHIAQKYGLLIDHVMLSFKVLQKRVGSRFKCDKCGRRGR